MIGDRNGKGSGSGASAPKNYITPDGHARLVAERKKLWTEDRPEVVRVVEWAAGNGDRSENGDYIYGKKRLREIDKRIRFLDKRLEVAEIVDPTRPGSRARVHFGATVRWVREDDREVEATIVGIDETDFGPRRISWISPMAKALIGKSVGDMAVVRTPNGEETVEVLAISYPAS
jgi:transcription elongation factor GreB